MNGMQSKIIRHRVYKKYTLQLNAYNPILLCYKMYNKLDHVVKHDVTVQIQIQNKNVQLKLPIEDVHECCSNA